MTKLEKCRLCGDDIPDWATWYKQKQMCGKCIENEIMWKNEARFMQQ